MAAVNKKGYQCCIFDLDGTLLDSSEGLYSSMRYTVKKVGLPPFPEERLYTIIGPPIKVSLINQYHIPDDEAEEYLQVYRKKYNEEGMYGAKVYDGIPELLQGLRDQGCLLALGTYKVNIFAERMMRHFDLYKYFDFIGSQDEAGVMTKSDIINTCVDALVPGCPEKALMIGDSFYDAEGAQASGIDFLAVTYGFGFRSEEDVKPYPYVGVAHSVREVGEFYGKHGHS